MVSLAGRLLPTDWSCNQRRKPLHVRLSFAPNAKKVLTPQNVFFQIVKYICQICKIVKCINCTNHKIYCPNYPQLQKPLQVHSSRRKKVWTPPKGICMVNVFVQTAKCICSNCNQRRKPLQIRLNWASSAKRY